MCTSIYIICICISSLSYFCGNITYKSNFREKGLFACLLVYFVLLLVDDLSRQQDCEVTVTLSHSQKSEKDKCSFSSFTSFPFTFNSVQAQSGGWWLTHTPPCSPNTYTEEGERRAFLSVCLFCLTENVKWGHSKGEMFDLCYETPSYVWL